MPVYNTFIGIDIGKYEMVVGIHGTKLTQTFHNTQDGFDNFYKNYQAYMKDALIILETTGGYEKLFLKNLLKKGEKVHRANTRHVKSFIKSLGIKGKTDAIDALGLARFGYERHDRLALYKLPESRLEDLRALAQRRLDLNRLIVQEKNRLQAPTVTDSIKESCVTVIHVIQEELKSITVQTEDLIEQFPELNEKRKVIEIVSGIGEITSLLLVILVPELGQVNRRQIASLLGLAPHPNESGKRIGYRSTHGGRQDVKNILFMAGMAACNSKSKLGEKYRKMVELGKKKMVALVAIMRNIAVIANAKVKEYLLTKEVVKASL